MLTEKSTESGGLPSWKLNETGLFDFKHVLGSGIRKIFSVVRFSKRIIWIVSIT